MAVVRLLIKKGADARARNMNGSTPLHFAAAAGQTDVVEALLVAGIDVNTLDASGTSPLLRAADAGQTESTLALIAAGGHDGQTRKGTVKPLEWGQAERNLPISPATKEGEGLRTIPPAPLVPRGQLERIDR